MDALIRDKFDKVDIYSDLEMTENYMQDIINQQPSNIRAVDEDRTKADRDWMDKHPDFFKEL